MTLACWDDPAILITSLKHNEHLYHVDFDSDVNIDVSRAWLLAGSPTAALPYLVLQLLVLLNHTQTLKVS